MASDKTFVDYACEQMRGAHDISSRAMFGEYAIYSGDKVVALVCDNSLFVKPTEVGREMIGKPTEAPPYPGAKPCFVLDDRLDDAEFISRLIIATERALPAPKKKAAKKSPDKKSVVKKSAGNKSPSKTATKPATKPKRK